MTPGTAAKSATEPAHLRGIEIAVAVVIAASYLYFSATDLLVEFGGDNAVYWLTANHYSPFGEVHPIAAEFAAASKYPPLYPAVLAVLGGGTSVLAAHIVSAALLCLGLFATRALFIAMGIPRIAALVLVVVVAMLPVMRFGATELQSEDLFLPVTMGALILMVGLERSDGALRLLVLGILLAAAVLTRTAAVALVAAHAAYALAARRPRWLLPIGLAALAWVGNSLVQHSSGRYAGELLDLYGREGVLAQLRYQFTVLAFEWARTIGHPAIGWAAAAPRAVVGALLCFGAVWRAWLRKADGVYALCYLGLVFVWPFPAEFPRLVSMIVPVLLGQSYLLIAELQERLFPSARSAALVSGVVALPLLFFAGPDTVQYVTRMIMPVPAELRPLTRSVSWQRFDAREALEETALMHSIYATMLDIRRLVPADECVFSNKPSIVSLYGRRRSIYTPSTREKDAFTKAAKAGGCRYFLLSVLVSPSAPDMFHPYAILKDELVLLTRHIDPFGDSNVVMAALAEWRPPAESR